MPTDLKAPPETSAEAAFMSFAAQMHADDPLIARIIDRGDGTCLIIKRLLFHWTLLLNEVGDRVGYLDRWCYVTGTAAAFAAAEWAGRGFEGEPTGWHRHPPSGRRRVDGDPDQETIAP